MEKKLLNKGTIQTEQPEHNGPPAASHDPTLYRVFAAENTKQRRPLSPASSDAGRLSALGLAQRHRLGVAKMQAHGVRLAYLFNQAILQQQHPVSPQ